MKRVKKYLKNFFLTWIAGVMVLCTAVFLYGCGNSPDKANSPAETNRDRADFATLVKQTDRMLSGDERDGKPGKDQQDVDLTGSTSSPAKEAEIESTLAGHELDFFFPTQLEENNYLKILAKDICDPETVARRRKESEGLVSCATWKARLKKTKTLMKMNISRYEDAAKAWEAIDRMRSTGGFIAGDVILTGDEEWPGTTEGQIEARSFIKSYYGRIRPVYVYKNEMGKPEDYLLENDRELEALKAGK
jgi:hypothetical protein